MVFDLTSFPLELQENILEKLTGQTLIKVSKVCKLWRSICEWVAKKKYAKIIPSECIQEIKSNGIYDEIWLKALTNHFLQQYLINNMLDYQKHIVVELLENEHICFCVFGPLIFIGCDSGKIEIYNVQENYHPVLSLTMLKKSICHLEVMAQKNVLLVKAGRNDLEFFSLPYFSQKSWVYKMNHLKPVFENFSNELHCERNFSIYNNLLATAINPHEFCIFQVEIIDKQSIKLLFCMNYIANEAISFISLWQNEIIILFKSGEILKWCLSTKRNAMSKRYHEIQYENPVWIYRGTIFCSTLISSQLLGYWHMSRGSDYWLLGKPNSDLIRCRNFGTRLDHDTTNEDILCICINQRLLACGTEDGKILLYYLSDQFFSAENYTLNGNEHLKSEFNRMPDLTIRMEERPLKNIYIQFGDDFIRIYAWPYMVKSGPGSKGILQCVLLKEGEWVKEKDKELIEV